MKRFLLTYLLLTLIFFSSHAQNQGGEQDSLPTAFRIFYEIDFSHSVVFYKKMIAFDPKNPVFYYKLGFAYLNIKGKADSAVYYLTRALQLYRHKYHDQINRYALNFYRAYAFYLNNQIDSAIRIVQNLQQHFELPEQFIQLVNNLNDSIDLTLSDVIRVQNLGSNINSQYTEHSPVFDKYNNQLLFTSRRPAPNRVSHIYRDGQYDENIYISKYNPQTNTWSPAQMWKQIDTIYNQATCSFNPDNKIIIIYKDEGGGNLYWSKLINERWTALHKFPRPINTGYEETHGSISSDGKILYFAAYRPDGFGGKDIWMSKLLPDGTWSKPINLGPNVNTAGDEDAPYITPDGRHLYFSSTGHNSLGGYDIFVVEKDEFGSWDAPQNLGYPINTIYDDIFFYPVDSATAYFASNRPGGFGHGDIYRVDYLNLKKDYQINICYLKGFNTYRNVIVKIADYLTGETYIARPNQTGKFIFVTKPDHTYRILIESPQGQTLYNEIINTKTNSFKNLREIKLTKTD